MSLKVFFYVLLGLGSKSWATCSLGIDSITYSKVERGVYAFTRDVERTSIKDEPHQGFEKLKNFQNNISSQMDIDPNSLLRKQREFFKNMPEELVRYDLILSGQVGRIIPIRCLEAYILDKHLSRFSHDTEFEVYLFSHPQKEFLKIMVHTQNKRSIAASGYSRRFIARQLRRGWVLEAHLHNHPFFFDNPYGDVAGTPIPSNPDIFTYIEMNKTKGLKSSIVTNGFHSFVLMAEDFKSL